MEEFDDDLPDLITQALNEIAEEAEEEDVGEVIEEFYDGLSEAIYDDVVENMDERIGAWQAELSGFRDRLYGDWKEAIDLLEALIIYSRDVGLTIDNRVKEDAMEEDDLVFLSLLKLHTRACQISQEILVLIKQGFADGAHARWRALHETAVVAMFIVRHEEDTAKRFLLHEEVDNYHLYRDIRNYEGTELLGEISDEEMAKLEERLDLLYEEFGNGFGGLWGWADHIIDNPRFKDLEEAVGLEHQRPYYNFASKANIHSGAKGTNAQIGALNRPHMTTSGPTNAGFHLPGIHTSVSLFQVTTSLMSHIVLPETLADLRVMNELLDDIHDAFMNAQEKIEKRDREMIEEMLADIEENMDELLDGHDPDQSYRFETRIDVDPDSE